MTAFTSHFAFEFKTGLRNPTAMLMNYLFPLGFYAMMGLVMTQINPG
jgi:ABC-2 type transport system permease protein